MNLLRIFTFSGICCALFTFALTSCTSKQQSTDKVGDLTDLKDFPKEWILAADLAPEDSVGRNYVILIDSSNSFLGGITIKQNGNDWQMINSGFYYPGTYTIKNCKRTNQAEMVYFDFDLENVQDTSKIKLNVNFRHDPGQADNIPSVFTCTTCDNRVDALLIEKNTVNSYTKKALKSIQYD
jgi:hypothetical protein